MNNNFTIQRPDQVVNVMQRDIKKTRHHIGRLKIHPGQTLWELNTDTLNITPVKYDVTAVHLDGSISSEVMTKENCLYCVAVNERNAIRKFILMCNKITNECSG